MAGQDVEILPSEIHLTLQVKDILVLINNDDVPQQFGPVLMMPGQSFRLPYEFLRVYSPSAEVRGHGPGQEVLQTGKKEVQVLSAEPVGSYALQPVFSGNVVWLGQGAPIWSVCQKLASMTELRQ